jgi:hypothetical protein
MMEIDELERELKKPFQPHEIKWRVQNVIKSGEAAFVLAYIDARTAQDRFDEVVGVDNWQTQFRTQENGFICRIGIKIGDEWVWKADGASETDFEGFKGGLSSAFKRAASAWGVSRYLYRLDDTYVELDYDNPYDRDFQGDYNGDNYGFDRPDLPDFATPEGYEPSQSSNQQASSSGNNHQKQQKSKSSNSSQQSKNKSSNNQSNNESQSSSELNHDDNPELTFGKFEGTPIGEVDSWYLDYLKSEMDGTGTNSEWLPIIEQELEHRIDEIFSNVSYLCDELDLNKSVIKSTCNEVFGVDSRYDLEVEQAEKISEHLGDLMENDEVPTLTNNNALPLEDEN